MATRLYGANPSYNLEQVTEAVGSPTTAHMVELTVDLSLVLINDNGSTRGILKNEVLLILDLFEQYITRSNWPPA
jgi:hypothetical protein